MIVIRLLFIYLLSFENFNKQPNNHKYVNHNAYVNELTKISLKIYFYLHPATKIAFDLLLSVVQLALIVDDHQVTAKAFHSFNNISFLFYPNGESEYCTM